MSYVLHTPRISSKEDWNWAWKWGQEEQDAPWRRNDKHLEDGDREEGGIRDAWKNVSLTPSKSRVGGGAECAVDLEIMVCIYEKFDCLWFFGYSSRNITS